MRYFELLEAPIGSIDFYGPSEPASMRSDDIGIVRSQKGQMKIKRVLEKAPVLINLVFVNHKHGYYDNDYGSPKRILGSGAYASGEMSRDNFKKIYGIDLAVSPNALTVAFGMNEGDERMPFTPWIIAHRIGHALHEKSGSVRGGEFTPLMQQINNIFTELAWDDANIMGVSLGDVAPVIGTWKSARDDAMVRPGEFVMEAFAQYLVRGSISLNPLPIEIPFKRSEKHKTIVFKDDYVVSELNEDLERWRKRAEKTFLALLQSCVGKIVVM